MFDVLHINKRASACDFVRYSLHKKKQTCCAKHYILDPPQGLGLGDDKSKLVRLVPETSFDFIPCFYKETDLLCKILYSRPQSLVSVLISSSVKDLGVLFYR